MFYFDCLRRLSRFPYSFSMIYEIAPLVYRAIRETAGLTVQEVAASYDRQRQAVNRIENGDRMPTREQEEMLVKKANLPRRVLVEIMCKELTEFLGRRVMIAPDLRYSPTTPLEAAAELYNHNIEKLDVKTRERVQSKLHHGRLLEATAEQSSSLFAKEVRELIEDALSRQDEPVVKLDSE